MSVIFEAIFCLWGEDILCSQNLNLLRVKIHLIITNLTYFKFNSHQRHRSFPIEESSLTFSPHANQPNGFYDFSILRNYFPFEIVYEFGFPLDDRSFLSAKAKFANVLYFILRNYFQMHFKINRVFIKNNLHSTINQSQSVNIYVLINW